MRNEVRYCKETKKCIYSSEAKATRALYKYEDLQRVYFCKHCSGFHTTSQTVEETLQHGEVDCEEENRLLKEYNNKLVGKLNKQIKQNKDVSEANKTLRLIKARNWSFIIKHDEIPVNIKDQYREFVKNKFKI